MNVQTVSYQDKEARTHFMHSLRETGFAVLTDHPISTDLIFKTYQEWETFFNSEDKHRYTFDPGKQSGFFPFRSENAKDYNQKDLKEFFHLYPWSNLPDGFSNQTWELRKKLSSLANELLSWIEKSLPQDLSSKLNMPLSQMTEGSQETLLRILHYPPLQGNEEAGEIRAAAHEDINLITLLSAATAPGLQVKDNQGNWHDVACDPGNIVINSGDMLKMLTDGYLGSTTHRVVNPSGALARKSRFSMPFFLHPKSDVKLSNQYTAGSYLKERLKEIGLIKKS